MRVVWRDGRLQPDNGLCRETALVSYFAGRGPAHTANCKKNEVEIPRVVGMSLARARLRLAGQPLTPNIVYKPAQPKQRVDLVLDQFPRRGAPPPGTPSHSCSPSLCTVSCRV